MSLKGALASKESPVLKHATKMNRYSKIGRKLLEGLNDSDLNLLNERLF